jgi:predicted nucleic-acid-binding Zn-ribbon protein
MGLRKEKRIKFTCKRCKFTELRPFIKYPRTPGRIELAGLRMQATGSAMSVGLSGTSKGGYAAAAQIAEQRALDAQLRTVCPECGSRKTKQEVVKV